MLPEHVREEIRGLGEIRDDAAVGGGCISPAFHVWLASGMEVFVKLAPKNAPAAILAAEAHSLEALRSAGAVRVPGIVARGEQWLALEWLEPARGTRVQWAKLGNALALLHRVRDDAFGWRNDNFIGTLTQTNRRTAAWAEFWREQRIAPQLERARKRLGAATVRDCETLMMQFEELLRAGDTDGASLLHGDLWSGNVHMSARGAALIDPASYYGHREVDLAMAALFGGFPPEFFDAYEAEWPLLAGAERRRHVYQLYYLLVHVNLFGGGYVAGTAAAIRNALD